MKVLCFGIALTVLLVGCTRNKTFPDSDTVARVKVAQDGTIYLNGARASLEEVQKNFEQLKANKGRVRYYREGNPQGEPPAQAMSVMKAVVDAGLPIKLCTSEADLNGTD